MKRQTAGLLICIRGCGAWNIPPTGDELTDLPASARHYIATLTAFPSILPDPAPWAGASRQLEGKWGTSPFMLDPTPNGEMKARWDAWNTRKVRCDLALRMRTPYLPAHPPGAGSRKIWRCFEHELKDWLNNQTNGAIASGRSRQPRRLRGCMRSKPARRRFSKCSRGENGDRRENTDENRGSHHRERL